MMIALNQPTPQDKIKALENLLNEDAPSVFKAKICGIIGMLLMQLGNFEEAIQYSERAITFNLNYAEAYYCKGLALFSLKRYSEAIEYFDQATKYTPSDSVTHIYKARALLELDRVDEAEVSIQTALQCAITIEEKELASLILKQIKKAQQG